MVRGKRPVRGGKRKFDERREKKPKPKRGKFNIREASYVKERDAKNAEIENRRKRLEEEKEKRRAREQECSSSEEEEENPMTALLATFSEAKSLRRTAIESESEEDTSEEEERSDSNYENKEFRIDERNEKSEDESNLEEDDEEEDEDASKAEKDLEELSDATKNIDEEVSIKIREEENEEDAETAREDEGNLRDPFSVHFNKDLSEDFYKSVSALPPIIKTIQLSWPIMGKLIAQIPTCHPSAFHSPRNEKSVKISLLADEKFAEPANPPSLIDVVDWNKLCVKSQIQPNLAAANEENLRETTKSFDYLTPLQRELFSIVNNYQDLLYNERNFVNSAEIRFVYCLHAINHSLKTRTRILHHNAKLSKTGSTDMALIPEEYRDQGLVRPKILIIVPFRNSCLKIVESLISILIGEDKGGSVMNKKRFYDDFTGNEISMPRKNPKPEDYEKIFAGNTDDTFKIGLSITKKSLKLYADFYHSDIIIASALGLRMTIGAEGEEERDYDFLASIEMLIIDQMEIFKMQNWDHLVHVLEHAHLQPKNSHGTDFSRVRSWCVDGRGKYYRQTLVFSGINLPEIQSIFNKKCYNWAGKLKTMNSRTGETICRVFVQVPQIFHKFSALNPSQASCDGRYEFFISTILPRFRDAIMNHTLIYVSSYFDFVKLRNYFKSEELSFVQICEYSRDAKIARARDMFFHSDAHFMLYSERYHFFRRIRVKGIRHLIFFEPPTFPDYYAEMCNLMHESNQNLRAGAESNMSVTTIYCRYDALRLGAIVGNERARRMLASEKTTHMLMSGE